MSGQPSGSPPDLIASTQELDDRLSEPTPAVIETLARLEGDLIVLGVAGKMGPTLARMALRTFDAAGVRGRVIGVARFSTPGEQERLRAYGIETISCDLLDPAQLDGLPVVPNVVFMAGRKFGSTGQEGLTWAVNTLLPGLVARKYRGCRIVAFSTGNVYGLTRVARGGSREDDPLRPVGEYAMSCLGRERVFAYHSEAMSSPTVLIRLNYATEMRYGVLVDVARAVWDGRPIDVGMGYLNTIWQGDAAAWSLQAFDHAAVPATVLNVTGPGVLSVRELAERFGVILGRPVTFCGAESDEALLADTSRARRLFGAPRVGIDQLIAWTADWVRRGGPFLEKPTHFQVRDGAF